MKLAPLYRMDEGDARFYARIGNFNEVHWYPSVTTVVGATSPTPESLINWIAQHGRKEANRLRDEAAEYGTAMHILASEYIEGKPLNLAMIRERFGERMVKDLLAWAAFIEERDVKLIASELMLYSDFYKVAGTTDLVCEMDWDGKRVTAIVDLKSGRSFYESHAVQVAYYAAMYNKHALASDDNDFAPVTEWFNWAPKDWTKAPTYSLKRQTDAVSTDELESRSELWRHMTPRTSPKATLELDVDTMHLGGVTPCIRFTHPDEVILIKAGLAEPMPTRGNALPQTNGHTVAPHY